MQFDEYFTRNILANNIYGITGVYHLRSLSSRFFDGEEYPAIESMIRENNIGALNSLPPNTSKDGEFLEIMFFEDQVGKEYIVTVYDSLALEQDPQVISIYQLK